MTGSATRGGDVASSQIIFGAVVIIHYLLDDANGRQSLSSDFPRSFNQSSVYYNLAAKKLDFNVKVFGRMLI